MVYFWVEAIASPAWILQLKKFFAILLLLLASAGENAVVFNSSITILYCWTTSSFLVDEDYCGDASGEKGRGKSCRISRVCLVFFLNMAVSPILVLTITTTLFHEIVVTSRESTPAAIGCRPFLNTLLFFGYLILLALFWLKFLKWFLISSH